MTREAKIGLVTGLFVIVLIGVLLSEYLGTPAGTGGGAGSTTGRMAALPLSQSYRDQVMQPVGVPGTVPQNSQMAGNAPVTPGMGEVPRAFAAVDTANMPAVASPGTVVIGQPVAAVPAGQVQPVALAEGNVPTINLGAADAGTVYVAGQPAAVNTQAASVPAVAAVVQPPAGDIYVIASGDSLPKIAKKYYHSAKNSDVARIVAANPRVLKDANTVLVVGKKLFIPARLAPAVVAPVAVVPQQPVVVVPPAQQPSNPAPAVGGNAAAPSIYVVKQGDSLGKIAHEIYPGSAAAMEKKIMALNGIKNANDLQVGEKLKMPAKAG